MRVKIIDIHKSDSFYQSGIMGILGNFKEQDDWGGGWKGGSFKPDLRTSLGKERRGVRQFYKVKVKEL